MVAPLPRDWCVVAPLPRDWCVNYRRKIVFNNNHVTWMMTSSMSFICRVVPSSNYSFFPCYVKNMEGSKFNLIQIGW